MTRGAADVRDARIVVEWITGRHRSFDRAVFCHPGVALGAVHATLGPGDVMFVPRGTSVETAAHVIPYDGAFDDIGDTLHVAGHSVELQHYAAAAYVELIGPTAVRFLDAAGWRAFLADADLARSSGVFTSPLTDVRLRLADEDVLRDPFAERVPASLHFHADGHTTAGAQGGTLKGNEVDAPQPRWLALAGITEAGQLVDDLACRPWLGRFLRAAHLIGALPSDDAPLLVDGFGWSALDTDGVVVEPQCDDPFLVKTPSGVTLADLRTRRRHRLPADSVAVVAAVQRSADLPTAAERVSAELGVALSAGERLCSEAVEYLGVRPGVPALSADAVAGGGA